jgi:hypothetical protein
VFLRWGPIAQLLLSIFEEIAKLVNPWFVNIVLFAAVLFGSFYLLSKALQIIGGSARQTMRMLKELLDEFRTPPPTDRGVFRRHHPASIQSPHCRNCCKPLHRSYTLRNINLVWHSKIMVAVACAMTVMAFLLAILSFA